MARGHFDDIKKPSLGMFLKAALARIDVILSRLEDRLDKLEHEVHRRADAPPTKGKNHAQ